MSEQSDKSPTSEPDEDIVDSEGNIDMDALAAEFPELADLDEDLPELPDAPDSEAAPSSSVGDEQLDDVDVKDLLRAALKPPPNRSSAIRRGVQERIRKESRGRFFADGWSRDAKPKTTFLLTTLLMLILTLLAWAILSPVGVEVFTG